MAWYSHCVKATPGQLDREPWYAYEKRAITLESELVPLDEGQADVEVRVQTEDGKVWATEITEHDATQVVLYRLMADSRQAAENNWGRCPNCNGVGKVEVGELAGMTVLMDCPTCTHLPQD